MKSILFMVLFFFFFLPQTQMIEVPIAVKPTIEKLPPKPYLPIYSLNEKSSPDEVVKAYVASVHILKISDDACRIKVEGIINAS